MAVTHEPQAALYWYQGRVARLDRERLKAAQVFTLWITKHSAADKSTFAAGTGKPFDRSQFPG